MLFVCFISLFIVAKSCVLLVQRFVFFLSVQLHLDSFMCNQNIDQKVRLQANVPLCHAGLCGWGRDLSGWWEGHGQVVLIYCFYLCMAIIFFYSSQLRMLVLLESSKLEGMVTVPTENKNKNEKSQIPSATHCILIFYSFTEVSKRMSGLLIFKMIKYHWTTYIL